MAAPPVPAVLKKTLSREPPPVLYHYTTGAGLDGIIRSQSLWATSILYLNDRKEFVHALEVARRDLDALEQKATPNERHVIQDLKSVTDIEIQDTWIGVCSLTEEGDLLSQWRGYGSSTGGYCVGFQASALSALCSHNKFELRPCIYNREDQESLIRFYLDSVLAESRRIAQPTDFPSAAPEFISTLMWIAPCLKDPSFAEEREWRLISPVINQFLDEEEARRARERGVKAPLRKARFAHRVAGGMLIPYATFQLARGESLIPIVEVIVGPAPLQELRLKSVGSFLKAAGLDEVSVRLSQVPYRTT